MILVIISQLGALMLVYSLPQDGRSLRPGLGHSCPQVLVAPPPQAALELPLVGREPL